MVFWLCYKLALHLNCEQSFFNYSDYNTPEVGFCDHKFTLDDNFLVYTTSEDFSTNDPEI